MRIIVLSAFLGLSGCAINAENNSPETSTEKQVEITTAPKEPAPHIWSDHKILKTSVFSCANKAQEILKSLGFNQVIKNGNYVYGNHSNNRSVIKCVSVSGKTFVYTAVAGSKAKEVEKLRNEIVWRL